jgi:hypothetical protein
MRLSLYYGDLSRAISNTNKLADELDDYCDSLSRRVQSKMYSVEGGMSSALNTADYYINSKIMDLRTKSSNARNLSQKINELLSTAKRVDSDVKTTIESNQKDLFSKHAELRPSNAQLYLTSFLSDMKKVPILGTLIRSGEEIGKGINDLKNVIRYWYKCEGGKELVGIVLSVASVMLAVVAVIAAVAALTFTSIFVAIVGIAGIIGALIKYQNAVTNVVTSIQAYNSAIGGHPGQAKIYAGQDKLSDVLRDRNFHDKTKNRNSNIAATSLDITETVCDVISIVGGISETWKNLKGFSIKKTFKAICQPRNADGTFATGKPSLWNGLKSITSKVNGKDMILGDLNVKNLSRLSEFNLDNKIKTIGKLSDAINGIVGDFDSINEGEMTFSEFMLKRLAKGLDKSILQTETLQVKENKKDGTLYSAYDKTKFATIVKGIRIPIDDIGIGKILMGLEPSGELKTILNPGSGLIGKIQNINTSISGWLPPKIMLDASYTATEITNWDSLQGYSNVEVVKPTIPVVNICPAVNQHTYVLPKMQFNINTAFRYPYFNVSVAV